MKKNLITLIVTISVLGWNQAIAQMTNNICTDAAVQEALAKVVTSSPSQIVRTEGEFSYDYSSVRRESDYFLVETPARTRILRMTPFTTSDFRPWYGVEETNVTFVDMISQEIFSSPLVTPETRGEHRATLTLDGRDIFIYVTYRLTTRYPTTRLTWGHSASYGEVGLEKDVFTCTTPSVSDVPPNKIVEIHALLNEAGLFGCAVTLERPFHPRHILQSSNEVIGTWTGIPRDAILINSGGTNLFYQSNVRNRIFFRLIAE